MSVQHKDAIVQLIREYQSFHTLEVEHLNSAPTALEFSRIVARNRPVVFDSYTLDRIPSLTGIDAMSGWQALLKWRDPEYLRRVVGDQLVTVAETPDGYLSRKKGIFNSSHADSIVDDYFVEPHQATMAFTDMLNWLISRRRLNKREGPVRYVQLQNGNLATEFTKLGEDVRELSWANECFGHCPL